MNIKAQMEDKFSTLDLRWNDLNLDPQVIKVILINEVVAVDPEDDFYGSLDAYYLRTTIPLFQAAAFDVQSMQDILNLGIYVTHALKRPKETALVERSLIKEHMPYLKAELELFPNVRAIMLNGDVAIKSFNMITKENTKKNIIPSISTYKLGDQVFYYNKCRIIPSYILTGKNLLIEKGKLDMISSHLKILHDYLY